MISMEWVKDYIDLDNIDLKKLAIKVTKAGINVEKVITNHIDNLVIGKVIECVNHPDSDHLHVCKVDIASEVLQIVCGANNVRENIKVIVAKIGAILPGNFEIKKGVIRGVESSGMICALFELGLEEKTEETYSKGIHILSDDAPLGVDPINYLKLDDTLYELDIHKHRNNDCYYHIGFAYEIAAILNKKVILPDTSYHTINDDINKYFTLNVDTDKCPYYLAKMVKDVKVKESPEFIKKRLIAAGMRPINNIVDISNYVMLEFGQPMHFFDKNKLGNHITVRNAKENEEIVTLDGKNRVLCSNDIVITDGVKPVCIAGVMGGFNTEVDDSTNTILIESAIFNATSIRYTASNLNLKSEASIRYGKGLNYEYTMMAINRACHLLEKYADAKILDGTISHDVIDKSLKVVKFKSEDINSMLGINISVDDMKVELSRLDFDYTLDGDTFTATIPHRRLDIDANVNDIAEEIGRLYGYHNLVSTLPICKTKKGVYAPDVKYRKLTSFRLRSLGIDEVKTYTLISKEMSSLFNSEECTSLPNPLSMDKCVIRRSLISSLVNTYEYNKARKVEDIHLYEISKTYDKEFNEDTKLGLLLSGNYISNSWSSNKVKVDFYLVKGIIENLLSYLGFKNRYTFVKSVKKDVHNGICADIVVDREVVGYLGKAHPNIGDFYVCELSLSKLMAKNVKAIKYKEISKYPSISKDLAFVMNKSVTSDEVSSIIKKVGGRLVTNIDVFDVYTGSNVKDDEKSIAYTITFQDDSKTLTDNEVMEIFNKIITEVTNKLNVILRG